MILSRLCKIFLILLFISTTTFASEIFVNFKEESIPIANEIIRGIRKDIQNLTPRLFEVNTIADGDVTPDVTGGNVFVTSSNTGATAITTFDNATEGQLIILIGGSAANSSTIADGGAVFFLTANFTAGLHDSLTLYYNGSVFIELARANN